jgi:small subunit ribosomal protein S29
MPPPNTLASVPSCSKLTSNSTKYSLFSAQTWQTSHVAPSSLSRCFSATPLQAKMTPQRKDLAEKKKAKTERLALGVRKGRKAVVTVRPPAVGERKAMRKRIVLSNTNAFEVQEELTAQNIAELCSRCKVFSLPAPVVDSLRAVEAFKPNQGWSMFRKPSVLWRDESVQLAHQINAVNAQGKQDTRRLLLAGEKGSGKTVMLLQAMAAAFVKEWVVVNIPDGTSFSRPKYFA